MSRYRSHRLASCVCACSALSALILTQGATANPDPPVEEDPIKCNVLDHEIFGDLIAYQEPTVGTDAMGSPGKLAIGRLRQHPGRPPYSEATVFQWGPFNDFDPGVMPPLGDTSNGPEIGFDGVNGYEVVYTRLNQQTGQWSHARQAANQCSGGPIGKACFQLLNFPNTGQYDNRWAPFVTQNVEIDPPTVAKVVYNAADDPTQQLSKRKVFRDLEDTNLAHEVTIQAADQDAATVGRWARIDDKDYIISTLGSPTDTEVKVVLYDPDDPQTPISLTENNPGKYAIGSIAKDPAAGDEYTLVTARTDDATGHTLLAVFQKDGPAITDWTFRYEFEAVTADPGLANSTVVYVTSPEPFEYGDFLYVVFVVADAPDFGSSTIGNIMLTRVEEDADATDNHYRILNTLDHAPPTTVPTTKRIEPEIHFLPNANPAIYYDLVADEHDPGGCGAGIHTLMRALTGNLWVD